MSFDLLATLESDATAVENTIGKEASATFTVLSNVFEKVASANPALASQGSQISSLLKQAASTAETAVPNLITGIVNDVFVQYGLAAFTPEADAVINLVIPLLQSKLTANKPAAS